MQVASQLTTDLVTGNPVKNQTIPAMSLVQA